MAEAVIFFLTSASNITGEFLIVDAGTHLGRPADEGALRLGLTS